MRENNGYQNPRNVFEQDDMQEVFEADYESNGGELQYEREYPMRKSNRTMTAVLLVIIVGLLLLLFQQGKLAELKVQEANLLAEVILAQEETLFMYGILPDMVPGLPEIKEAWFNDPCIQNAQEYSNALNMILEYLEKNYDIILPPESNDYPQAMVV